MNDKAKFKDLKRVYYHAIDKKMWLFPLLATF